MKNIRNKLLAKLLTRFPSLADRAAQKVETYEVTDNDPWTPVIKELSDSRLALITTAGVHLKSQEPFDMVNTDGDATFRVILNDLPVSDYAITHDYYDHSDADKDVNIVFPIDRLRELVEGSFIGSLAARHYGFMGHIDGALVDELVTKTAPAVARMLAQDMVDCVLLTPG